MKIPFQDSRAGGNRRWTDYRRLQKVRFLEIYQILEGCQELRKTELMELNRLIERKLRTFQRFPSDKTALAKKRESQMEMVDLRPPSAVIKKSNKQYQNFFWCCYEKLLSLGEKSSEAYSKDSDREDEDGQNRHTLISY
jgi:hypothetical protein